LQLSTGARRSLNLWAAKKLSITIPQTLLARADAVIETTQSPLMHETEARLAEEEKARLRAEGAKQAEQAKAAAGAKAAEEARVAAEKSKQVQQEKVAAAEQARAAAEKLAAEKLAAQKAAAEKLAADKAEAAKVVEDKAAAAKVADATKREPKSEQQVASLPPTIGPEAKSVLSGTEIARALQSELRRVGCSAGSISDDWNAKSQRSLDLFNKQQAQAGGEGRQP
jgi:hypothetical protein